MQTGGEMNDGGKTDFEEERIALENERISLERERIDAEKARIEAESRAEIRKVPLATAAVAAFAAFAAGVALGVKAGEWMRSAGEKAAMHDALAGLDAEKPESAGSPGGGQKDAPGVRVR